MRSKEMTNKEIYTLVRSGRKPVVTLLYLSLMNSIEAERIGYLMEEKKLLDLANSHTILRLSFPTSLFLSGRPEIVIKIVSSDKTKEILESGIDNDSPTYNRRRRWN